MDAIFSALTDLGAQIRLADLVDIAIVAAFFYAVILLLQRSISRRAIRSILGASTIFLATYVLARLTGLFLIELVVEVLFFLLIVGAILIFQEDLRRIIDHLGGWNLFSRSRSDDTSPETIDILTEAAEKLAEQHTGALIALKGQESWQRLIHGGIDVDGEVSQPLLYSLFNPTSPGHDGAILLNGERVLRFGAHLPLSTRLSGDSELGTRHAAGLGLSERCDALVIIVSEERGEISVAENGTLAVVDTPSELKSRLQQFWETRYLPRQKEPDTGWNFRQVRVGFLSVVLAGALWLLFIYDPRPRYRPIEAPIAFEDLPSQWHVEEPSPGRATVFLSGSRRAFDRLNTDEVVISVNVQNLEEGVNDRVLTARDVRLPPGLQVTQIEPQEVEFTAQKMRARRAAIHVETSGQLSATLEMVDLRVDPDSVTVLTPDTGTDTLSVVSTEPIDLSEISESTSITRPLVLPGDLQLAADEPREITIAIEVRESSDGS